MVFSLFGGVYKCFGLVEVSRSVFGGNGCRVLSVREVSQCFDCLPVITRDLCYRKQKFTKMKIVASVHIANRLLPAHNMCHTIKTRTSSLTIAKETGKEGKVFILLQCAQNKVGTKYMVSAIDDILTRFIKQGTMTIRFNTPPHDLYIKGDVLLLQNFMKVIRLAQQKKIAVIPLLSSCTPFSTKTVKKPTIKLVITQKQDYPVLEGFPRTLETLKVCGIGQSHFDERILLLPKLKVLDLSNNKLMALPSLSCLSNLHTLVMAQNNLGSSGTSWAWLHGSTLQNTLRELDLSSNCLHVLPEDIYSLHSLVTLKVSNNQLTRVSFGVSKLAQLRFFDVSHNKLQSLPCTMRHIKLHEIDVSENKLHVEKFIGKIKYTNLVPSLFHLCATKVLEYRLPYSSANIPSSVANFLNEAGYCLCGKAVFSSAFRVFVSVRLLDFVPSVRGQSIVPLETYACSSKCYSNATFYFHH